MTDTTNPETEVEPEVDEVAEPETEAEDTEGEESETPTEPEVEEVEHEGQKYKIPKPLKGALLMHADYTRKTQELAEQRRRVEEEFRSREKTQNEHIADIGRVQTLTDALAPYEKYEHWAALRQQNPAEYDQQWFAYQQLKEARDKAAKALNEKVTAKALETQRETARRVQNGLAELQRDIPGWSPELAGKLNSVAMEYGFTAQELSQVTDPRIIKILHAAYAGREVQKQTQTKQAATKTAKAAEAAKPLPTVTARTAGAEKVRPNEPAGDKLSTDEWLRRRNAQLKQRATR